MAERARVEATGDVEDDASRALQSGCRFLASGRVGGRRRRKRIGRVPARTARGEQGQGETRQFEALHGSGEDLTRVVFPARTSITY